MAHGSTSLVQWFIRVLLIVATLAVIGNDSIATFSGSVQVIDDANAAARAGLQVLSAGGNWSAVDQAASNYAFAHGDQFVANSTLIGADGSVTVKLRRPVKTILFGRLPGIRSVTSLSATGLAAPSA